MLRQGWPKMAFIEHRVAGDETNWWAPNHAGIEAQLRSAGFEVVLRPEHEFYLCKPVPVSAAASRDLQRVLEAARMPLSRSK